MLEYKIQYNNICKLGNKEIHYRAWNTKDEKNYLIAVESEENITTDKIYDILIKPCIEEKDIILSLDEQQKLMLDIRKKSLGSTFPLRYECTKCKNVNDIDIELDNIIDFTESNFKTIELNDDNTTIKITFNTPKTNNLINKVQESETNVEKNYINFLIHIEKVSINNKEYNDFTFNELNTFIENLPSKIFNEFLDEFNKMKAKLSFINPNVKCLVCDNENEIEIEEIPNFLWV